jgi:hypothetical protein
MLPKQQGLLFPIFRGGGQPHEERKPDGCGEAQEKEYQNENFQHVINESENLRHSPNTSFRQESGQAADNAPFPWLYFCDRIGR